MVVLDNTCRLPLLEYLDSSVHANAVAQGLGDCIIVSDCSVQSGPAYHAVLDSTFYDVTGSVMLSANENLRAIQGKYSCRLVYQHVG